MKRLLGAVVRQPELQERDEGASCSGEVGGRVSPPARGGRAAEPSAAGFSLEVKIAEAVYSNTRASRGAQSVGRNQR